MSWRMDDEDPVWVIYLKLCYLVPVWLLLVVPTCVVIGWQSTSGCGLPDLWRALRTGSCRETEDSP